MRGRGGRGAARRGSPDGGDGEVDCVLAWVNGAAGGSTSFGDLRLALESLIHCKGFETRASRGAPEQKKENRLGEHALGSPSTSESSGKPADVRISVDEFRRLRFVPSGETKGRE
jgi:hypothetical protein